MKTITFEEKRILTNINDLSYSAAYSCSQKSNKRFEKDEETVSEVVRYFMKIDKRPKINVKITKSEYVYQKDVLLKILQKLKELKISREIGFRNISSDMLTPCYEINFVEVLENRKPKNF